MDELRSVTWDYSCKDITPLMILDGKEVLPFLFEVRVGTMPPSWICRCNVAEGWVEHWLPKDWAMFDGINFTSWCDPDGKAYVCRIENVRPLEVDVLDKMGNVLMTLTR